MLLQTLVPRRLSRAATQGGLLSLSSKPTGGSSRGTNCFLSLSDFS